MTSAVPADFLLEHGYAQVNGLRLHYVTAGRGRLMLFVHGFPEFWYAWNEQLAEFARDFRVLAPDMRGINLSDKPADVKQYRAVELVEDLRQLIEQFGGGRAIVVAHDWGGAAAWNLAAQHPGCVEQLVILNAPHPILFARELRNNPAQQAASQYMLALRGPDAERIFGEDNFRRLRQLFEGWGQSVNPPTAEMMTRYREAWSQPGALTAALNYYRATPLKPRQEASAPPDMAAARARFTIRVPTLVIWGDRDPALLPDLLEGLDEYVPDLRVVHIPEATHWIAHEYPARVNALIREFVSSA